MNDPADLGGARPPSDGDAGPLPAGDAAAAQGSAAGPSGAGGRRRWARLAVRGAAVVVGLVAVSVLLAAGAFVAASLSGDYGSSQALADTRSWAARTPRFALAGCRTCHDREHAAVAVGPHATVTCEACHGPQGTHGGSDPAVFAQMPRTTGDTCVRCHTKVPGRPAAFPQIDPTQHYPGGPCTWCHDPHVISALRPPEVTHPLTNLPACTTCHRPDGLKQLPNGHSMVPDAVCRTCHKTPQGS